MSEPRTALDLAETWKDRQRMRRYDDAGIISRQLDAIPADATEQIARLRDELAWAKGLATKLAAEAAAGVEARRG